MPSTAVLLVELGLVVVGLAIMARLAGRLGFSPIPLYLLAGFAFGKGGLVPLVTAEAFIELGADIGVILLLVMLGLQYSAEDLKDTLGSSGPTGLTNLALNMGPGVAAGFLLGWSPVEAVLLGGITYMTSSGVVAKLIEDLGWVGNREAPVVLSILVMEDLTMAVYLPVMAVLLRGGGAGEGIVSVVVAVAAVGAVLLFAFRYGAQMSRLVFSRSDEALLLTIFGLALVVAGAAERLQVSAAVGAFLLGIALSGHAADRARFLLTPLRDLFGAVFFVFFGLQIDPSTIPPVLLAAVGLAVVGLATKLLTGWLSTRRVGIGRRGQFRAGALLTARGEFSIAIAALGVGAGADPMLGPLAAAYVLVLAVAGPLLARAAGSPTVLGAGSSRVDV
ncbi:MAG TPA: cation:proton antiporter [Actinomycetota bacterium]|nr:cation:proton antiporter [Actinomycetota bacterium]